MHVRRNKSKLQITYHTDYDMDMSQLKHIWLGEFNLIHCQLTIYVLLIQVLKNKDKWLNKHINKTYLFPLSFTPDTSTSHFLFYSLFAVIQNLLFDRQRRRLGSGYSNFSFLLLVLVAFSLLLLSFLLINFLFSDVGCPWTACPLGCDWLCHWSPPTVLFFFSSPPPFFF